MQVRKRLGKGYWLIKKYAFLRLFVKGMLQKTLRMYIEGVVNGSAFFIHLFCLIQFVQFMIYVFILFIQKKK